MFLDDGRIRQVIIDRPFILGLVQAEGKNDWRIGWVITESTSAAHFERVAFAETTDIICCLQTLQGRLSERQTNRHLKTGIRGRSASECRMLVAENNWSHFSFVDKLVTKRRVLHTLI